MSETEDPTSYNQNQFDRVVAKHAVYRKSLDVANRHRAEYQAELFPLLNAHPNILTLLANSIGVSRQALFNQMKALRKRLAAAA